MKDADGLCQLSQAAIVVFEEVKKRTAPHQLVDFNAKKK